jgi:hypothetical protein
MVMFLDLYDPSDCVFWCIFLFAFFLMSRKSNLVPDSVHSFDAKKQLTRGKVVINKGEQVMDLTLLTYVSVEQQTRQWRLW